MLEVHQLVRIFCEIDDFCKQLENYTTHLFLTGPSKPKRGPSCRLSISEIMTILILLCTGQNYLVGRSTFLVTR